MVMYCMAACAVIALWLLSRRKKPKTLSQADADLPPQGHPALRDVTDSEWEQLRALEREAEIAKVRNAYNKRLERALKALSPAEGGAEGSAENEALPEHAGH